MASLLGAHDHLDRAWQSLQRQWQASRDQWDDPVSRGFEREFWQEYERVTPATMAEMQKLAEVIAQARRAVK
jgi:hypothetical protein